MHSNTDSWNWFAVFATLALFVGFFAFEQDVYTSTYINYTAETELREAWTEGGNRSRQLGAIGLAALGAICLANSPSRRLRLTDPLLLLAILYGLYIVASSTWSIDPDLTRRRLVVLAFFVVALLGLAKRFSPHMIPQMTMVVMTLYLVTGLATELALGTFKPWSGEHRFAGTTHPNSQATYMVVLCLAAWCVHQRPGPLRGIALPLMIVGFVFLLLTRSRTSLGGFLIAFTLANTVAADKFRYFRVVFSLSWLALALLLVGLFWGVDPQEQATELLNLGRRDTSSEEAGNLTGRLPLWEELWQYVLERPWLGHGYEAFWTTENFLAIADEIPWAPATAHSSYVECLLDLGIVGLVFTLLAITIVAFRLFHHCAIFREPVHAYVLAQFLHTLTFSFTEAGLRNPSAITFAMAWSVTSLLLVRAVSTNESPATQPTAGVPNQLSCG